MMNNNYETFEDILIENDFFVQEKPKPSIPKGVDAKTELQLHKQARIDMDAANWEIVKSVASQNYELLEKLTDLYLNASNPDREKIREFLKEIKRWREVFQHWWPQKNMIRENPERYLQLLLANQSMLDGGVDYRDTIMMLAPTWHMMEELGIDPEPTFHEAKSWGGDLERSINNVLNPELRQQNCRYCLLGESHLIFD